jgi:hypothetical protein
MEIHDEATTIHECPEDVKRILRPREPKEYPTAHPGDVKDFTGGLKNSPSILYPRCPAYLPSTPMKIA